MGLSLLPPAGERLWTLNTVRVPAGVDEAAVRKTLLTAFNLEVGAGLGPLAGKIWRVGLMGASSTPQTLLQFLAALEAALAAKGHRLRRAAGRGRGRGGAANKAADAGSTMIAARSGHARRVLGVVLLHDARWPRAPPTR